MKRKTATGCSTSEENSRRTEVCDSGAAYPLGEQLQTLVQKSIILQQVEPPTPIRGLLAWWYQERCAQPTEQRLITAPFHVCLAMTIAFLPHQIISNSEQWYSWLWLSYREHQITQLESPSAR